MPAYREVTWKDRAVTLLLVGVLIAVTAIYPRMIGLGRPVIFVLIVGALLALLVRWHAARFGYRCPECGNEFAISALRDFLSPHTPTSKYLRCPKCGVKDWAQEVRKAPDGSAT